MVHYISPERLAMEKYSSLLSPFVSYKANEVLWIWTPGAVYTLHFLRKFPIGPMSRVFVHSRPHKPTLMFVNKAGAFPSEVTFRCYTLG